MFYQNRLILTHSAIFFFCLVLFWAFAGCADREFEARSDVSEELQKASESLAKAEKAMKQAGVEISFSELGSLSKSNLAEILPRPIELSELERDNPKLIQDAIVSLYEVFDAFPELAISVPAAPMAPIVGVSELSNSDIVLLHLHHAYLYVLKAVGRLALEGMGPDGKPNTDDDLFLIEFPEDFEEDTEKYKFELTEEGQARIDAIEQLPDPKPEDYLKQFRESERQAIIDALFILLGARLRILPVPSAGIKEQTPQVDRTIYRRDALFHLEKAVEHARLIAPDFETALDEFNRIIAEDFAEDFLKKAEEWHFEVENLDEVENRLRRMIEKVE